MSDWAAADSRSSNETPVATGYPPTQRLRRHVDELNLIRGPHYRVWHALALRDDSEDSEEVAAFVRGHRGGVGSTQPSGGQHCCDIAMLRLKIWRIDALEAGLMNG